MPNQTIVELPKFKCLRCSHEWYPRRTEIPTICPKCKTHLWNVPKKNHKVAGDGEIDGRTSNP